MATQQKAGSGEELSPHIRQRVAFIAALVPDTDNANWSAISDTFEDLSQECRGGALERSVESLRDPIQQRDAGTLIERIGAILSRDESSQPLANSPRNSTHP